MESVIFPVQLSKTEHGQLSVVWNDGHRSNYSPQYLRQKCNCAGCIDEWTREAILDPASVSPEIYPKTVESVGRYALHFDWSDGHSTGYYPFEYLRKLCTCPQCLAEHEKTTSIS